MSEKTQEEKSGNALTNYLRNSIAELKKVTWPSREEVWRKSWVVVGFSAGFGLFLGALDFVMNSLLEVII